MLNLRRLLSPAAYLRVLRDTARHREAMRAVTVEWRRWMLRSLLLPIYRMPCTIRARTGMRYRLADDPVDDAVLRHIHAHPALYFPSVRDFDPDGVILDIGAHHGMYAVEALRRYPRCRLIAVEPDAAACNGIAINVSLNGLDGRVRVAAVALAERSGVGRLERSGAGSWANQVLTLDGSGSASRKDSGALVPLQTLEELLAGDEPVIVKCNAEGAEFALVPQLIALGLRPRLIVLMVHPAFGSAADLVGHLGRVGYQVRDADDPPNGHRLHCCFPCQVPSTWID